MRCTIHDKTVMPSKSVLKRNNSRKQHAKHGVYAMRPEKQTPSPWNAPLMVGLRRLKALLASAADN